MKKKIYRLTFGEKIFEVVINRDIVADVFDKFKDYFADTVGLASILSDVKSDDSTQSNLTAAEKAIRGGKAKLIVGRDEDEISVARYALPRMLEVGENLSYAKAKAMSNEIFMYAEDNDAIMLLSQKIGDIIMEGFIILKGEEKPKITLTVE